MRQPPEMLDELLKDCKAHMDVESLYSRLLQRMINAVWKPGWTPI